MQSRDYRTLLEEIHGNSVDKWFESEEELQKERGMGGDTILEFIDREVWQDADTKKWCFNLKQFKRKGQAEKAAAEYFRRNSPEIVIK